MEELLEVLQPDDDSHSSSDSSSESEDNFMLLQLAPSAATPTARQRRTMRLHGMIDKQHVLILVDSGANSSFIDAALAAKLGRTMTDTSPTRFVALPMVLLSQARLNCQTCSGCVRVTHSNKIFMYFPCPAMT
jgi:hypothetical protein